jgi:site-specific DNA recombinase
VCLTLCDMERRRILDSYARESARGDRRQLSVTGQHEVNEDRIKALGADLGLRLTDQGRSAWRKGVVREDWNRLVDRLENGLSDGAVIFDLERLMRRVEDALRIVKLAERGLELEKQGTGRGFKIYDSAMEYDLTTPEGQSAFYNAAVKGQEYSARLSVKVSRGNRRKAMSGESKRGRYRGFGFEDDGTTVRESEREPIREVVRMILHEEKTWGQAAEYLASLGIYSTATKHTEECLAIREQLTPYKLKRYECDCKANQWRASSLRNALTHPRMAGYAKLGKTMGTLPGEPILTVTDWQALKDKVASRKGRPPMDPTLLSGNQQPALCANCGGHLEMRMYAPGSTYLDAGDHFAHVVPEERMGDVRRQYRCKSCTRMIGDMYVFDRVVSQMIIAILASKENAEARAKERAILMSARAPHEIEIKRLEDVRDHWDSQLNDGADGMTPERHSFLTSDIANKIKKEKEVLKSIGEVEDIEPVTETREEVVRKWNAASATQKRKMFRDAFSGRPIYIQPGSTNDLEERAASRIMAIPRQRSESTPEDSL